MNGPVRVLITLLEHVYAPDLINEAQLFLPPDQLLQLVMPAEPFILILLTHVLLSEVLVMNDLVNLKLTVGPIHPVHEGSSFLIFSVNLKVPCVMQRQFD